MIKIDCPSQPDRVFTFEIVQDNWEWEETWYMFHDGCSKNCTEMQMVSSSDEGNDRTRVSFQLSHASGQTMGGFVGPSGGYGYRTYTINSDL